MRKYSILVDAGFVKRKLGSQTDPVTSARIIAFLNLLRQDQNLAALTLHRIYIYDAPPLTDSIKKPLGGGTLNLGDTALAKLNTSLHQELASSPFVAMRYGELAFRGWKLRQGALPETGNSVEVTAGDLQPNIQQKAVDMRIGLDIASLTLKNKMDVIVLVTGDTDFIPAMKFARREGAQLFLVHLEHKVKADLLEHADLVIPFDVTAFRESTTYSSNPSGRTLTN